MSDSFRARESAPRPRSPAAVGDDVCAYILSMRDRLLSYYAIDY